ncbi:hypothetical protein HDU67_003210, partial [Dinochytrium kinnereticum]
MGNSAEPNDLVTVLVSVGVQTAIAFGLILAFSLLRPTNKVVYQPRLKFAPDNKKPKALGPEPTAWVGPIFTVNESASVGLLGLDAVIFLRYLKFLLRLFIILCLFGVPMIFIYYYYPKIVGKPADLGFVTLPVDSSGTSNSGNGVQVQSTAVTRTVARTVSGTTFLDTVVTTEYLTTTLASTSASTTGTITSAPTSGSITEEATTTAVSETSATTAASETSASEVVASSTATPSETAAPVIRANPFKSIAQRMKAGFHLLGKREEYISADEELKELVPAKISFGLEHRLKIGHGMNLM